MYGINLIAKFRIVIYQIIVLVKFSIIVLKRCTFLHGSLYMTIIPLIDEKDLLVKMAGGGQQAFRIIYDKYSNGVYNYALQLLHSKAEAEEMTQEVFLKLWLLGNSVSEISNLEAYLYTVTKHRSLNVLRRMILEGKVEKALGKAWREDNNNTEEEILMNDVRNVLNTAIELLPPQQKQVYILCQQQGLKYDEAAEHLNLSTLTVKTHMQRALKSVRAYVKANTGIAIALVILKLL